MDTTKDAKTITTAAEKIAANATTAAERDLAQVLAAVGAAMAALPTFVRLGEAIRWSTVCVTALTVANAHADPEPPRPEYLAEYPAHMSRRPRR